MKDYYQILGVSKHSDKTEIKKAYRKLALKYHPDISQDAQSTTMFLKITEAYEMLMSDVVTTYSSPIEKKNTFAKRQEEAIKKAHAYAKMKKKEFMNSDAYMLNQAKEIFFEQFYILSVIFLVFIMSPLFLYLWGIIGLGISIFLLLGFWAYWITFFTESKYKNLDLKKFITSIKFLFEKSIGFRISIMTLFCVYVFFMIFFNTVLDHFLFITIFFCWLILFFISYIILKVISSKPMIKVSYCFMLLMTAFMLFLLINYAVSYDKMIEEYSYERSTQMIKNKNQSTTLVFLEGNAYAESFGIRFFPSKESFKGGTIIQYQFKKGIFGLKVLKDYSFQNDYSLENRN